MKREAESAIGLDGTMQLGDGDYGVVEAGDPTALEMRSPMPTVVAASTSPGPIILRRSPTPRVASTREDVEADSSLLKRLLPPRTTDRGQHERARKRQVSSTKVPRRWSLSPWTALAVVIRQSESEYSGCRRAVNDSWYLNNIRTSDRRWGSAGAAERVPGSLTRDGRGRNNCLRRPLFDGETTPYYT